MQRNLYHLVKILDHRNCYNVNSYTTDLDNICKTGHVSGLTHVPVLVQALLGYVRLFQVYAQLQILFHDALDELFCARVLVLLGFNDFIKGIKGFRGLA